MIDRYKLKQNYSRWKVDALDKRCLIYGVNFLILKLSTYFSLVFHSGIWKSKEELKSLRKIGHTFHPRLQVKKTYELIISRWEDAVKLLCGWYSNTKSVQSVNSVSDSSSSLVTPRTSYKVTGEINGNSNYSKFK